MGGGVRGAGFLTFSNVATRALDRDGEVPELVASPAHVPVVIMGEVEGGQVARPSLVERTRAAGKVHGRGETVGAVKDGAEDRGGE